ncbi:immunity protein Imm33 domain-containing protein [Tropicibacter oceani]|uniref:DUF2185 domain-containing protein n=1 Tax=Tropicibacter oceani TaxID=3058420 RepID=A0ABY8QDF3_9RHOB|nr:DUF2185 domain-containing protein [Tropicibacter oceani]WGW02473.1 DUF2185 domain-containing protein [Tropicibacter oceani]
MFDDKRDGQDNRQGWRLVDPRPIHEACPYTFFLPAQHELAALQQGDLVKLMFEECTPDDDGGVERMWVRYERRDDHGLCHGVLDNQPFGFEGLSVGAPVTFRDFHVIALMQPRHPDPHGDAQEDAMFARCHVARSILSGQARIARIERHAPGEGGDHVETGWRLQAEGDAPLDTLQHVAIGAVLNLDDSILPYLDAPVGARFERDGDRFRPV